MQKFQLVLLIHAHQPVGNFESVLESSYQKSYLPFVDVLARHPTVRMGLHFSGSLLEWIERAHPEYFHRLRELAARGQIEIIGGGFYEPILISIPARDRAGQIARLSSYIETHFNQRPEGAWLAERVWEPQLPSTLAPAGVRYTLVDDNHFLAAGFEPAQLFGHYLAEDQGELVAILPGLKKLRYLIPFHAANDTVNFLRVSSTEHPGGVAYMGDDLEKFGVWPGTHALCYTNGWLESLFAALDQNSDWMETTLPSTSLANRLPLGRADLPAASYSEMMEWALPTPSRRRYQEILKEFSSHATAHPFFHGGTWRGFLSKYPESNLVHKKMLRVSEKLRSLAESVGSARMNAFRDTIHEAEAHLFRGQCNDAYWHGVFGGLYTPHLRTALWQSLVKAESLADRLLNDSPAYSRLSLADFDKDGRQEIYFTSDRCAALFKPSDGGTLAALDCRQSQTALINSMARREESYHTRLQGPVTAQSGAHSIHENWRSKEDGLDRWLHYDRWSRHCFRQLLFDGQKTFDDFSACRLQEDPALAAGHFAVESFSPTQLSLSLSEESPWISQRKFSVSPKAKGFRVDGDFFLARLHPAPGSALVGIEMVFNLLAPAAHDRFFELNGERHPLRWATVAPASPLRLVDEWQNVAISLYAPGALEWWISPIETVSESEDGYERIYQGSQILAVWPVDFSSPREWRGSMQLDVVPFR